MGLGDFWGFQKNSRDSLFLERFNGFQRILEVSRKGVLQTFREVFRKVPGKLGFRRLSKMRGIQVLSKQVRRGFRRVSREHSGMEDHKKSLEGALGMLRSCMRV